MRRTAQPLPVLALLLAVALAACAGSGRHDRDYGGGYYGDRVAFRCDDNRRFTVAFERNGRHVTVNTEDHSYDLRAEDDQGRGYGSDQGDVRLELDRDRAYLRVRDEPDYKGCEAR
jgi:hypothetical protein